jgi:hypothetical protein
MMEGREAVGTQDPPWQLPPGHELPSGNVALHFPFFRALHGAQGFLALAFLLACASERRGWSRFRS